MRSSLQLNSTWMIMGCALAVPVICIKTSEQNFLLYQCEFVISEQFNE